MTRDTARSPYGQVSLPWHIPFVIIQRGHRAVSIRPMGVLLVLDEVELTAEPGREVRCELRLRNTGAVVDQFTLELVGDVTEWAEITPAIVNLFPDSESTTELVFKPLRSSEVLAGEIPFAVKAMSREDPEGSVVEEGTVTVEPFTEVTAELVPHGSRGAFRGLHKLAVDNRGNTPIPINVRLMDAKNDLVLKVRPASQVLVPGTATLFPVKAIPKKRFLRGPQKTLPFQAMVTGEGFEPVTADAAMVQEQILPKWLPKVLAALFALAVTLGILWFTVLKPVLQTEAQNAAQQETSNLSASVSAANSAASAANSQASKADTTVNNTDKQLVAKGIITAPGVTPAPKTSAGAQGGSNGGQNAGMTGGGTGGGTGGSGPGSSAAAKPSPGTTPFDQSIVTQVAPNPGQPYQQTTMAATTATLISDLLISNAAGDHGFVQLQVDRASGGAPVTVLTLNMDDFVSQDEHFVQPIALAPGDRLSFGVSCTNTSGNCTPSVYVSGSTS